MNSYLFLWNACQWCICAGGRHRSKWYFQSVRISGVYLAHKCGNKITLAHLVIELILLFQFVFNPSRTRKRKKVWGQYVFNTFPYLIIFYFQKERTGFRLRAHGRELYQLHFNNCIFFALHLFLWLLCICGRWCQFFILVGIPSSLCLIR